MRVAKNTMIEGTLNMFINCFIALPLWNFVPHLTVWYNFLALLFISTQPADGSIWFDIQCCRKLTKWFSSFRLFDGHIWSRQHWAVSRKTVICKYHGSLYNLFIAMLIHHILQLIGIHFWYFQDICVHTKNCYSIFINTNCDHMFYRPFRLKQPFNYHALLFKGINVKNYINKTFQHTWFCTMCSTSIFAIFLKIQILFTWWRFF